MQKKKFVCVVALFCALSLLMSMAATMACQPANNNIPATSNVDENKIVLQDIAAWTVGSDESLIPFVDTVTSQGAKTASIDLNNLEFDSNLKSTVLSNRSIIVFDGAWLKQNDDQQLYDFLTTNVKDVGGIVVAGESATDLYLVLEKAGMYTIARNEDGSLRIPISDDATITGFALKETTTPNGEPYYVRSHFSTNNVDSYLTMRDIVNWLNVDCKRSAEMGLVEENILKNLDAWPNTAGANIQSSSYLQFVEQFNWPGLINTNPYGRLNVNFAAYKLMDDGSSVYDWYFYLAYSGASGINIQTEPGIAVFGSDWRTSQHSAVFDIARGDLAGYGPTNPDGYDSGSASASVSVNGGVGASYGVSYSYSIPWIRVDDYSSFYDNKAGWVHDFALTSEKGSSMNAHNVMPMFVVRTEQDDWALVDAIFSSDWGRPWIFGTWDYVRLWSVLKYADALYFG
jgi:hypothetical protein